MEQFLLKHYGVNRLNEIDPWKPFIEQGGVACWDASRTVTIRPEFYGPGEVCVNLPAGNNKFGQPKKPFRGIPVDLNRVSLLDFSILYAKSEPQANYHVQTNFVPVSVQEEQAAHDQILMDGGAIPRVIMTIAGGTDSEKHEIIHRSPPNHPIFSPFLVKTCALINNDNLLTGIVPLDPSLTQSLPKEAEVYDLDKNRVTFPIESWFLVPESHILAWKLQLTSEYRKLKGLFAQEISVQDKDNPTCTTLLFYIVCNRTLDDLIIWFNREYLNKVDLRPLGSFGFNFIPAAPGAQGKVMVRTKMTYVCWPVTLDIKRILPIAHKDLPPYSDIVQLEILEEKKREAQKNYGRNKGKK